MDLVLGKLVWLCDTKNQMVIILESSNDKKHDNPETLIGLRNDNSGAGQG